MVPQTPALPHLCSERPPLSGLSAIMLHSNPHSSRASVAALTPGSLSPLSLSPSPSPPSPSSFNTCKLGTYFSPLYRLPAPSAGTTLHLSAEPTERALLDGPCPKQRWTDMEIWSTSLSQEHWALNPTIMHGPGQVPSSLWSRVSVIANKGWWLVWQN